MSAEPRDTIARAWWASRDTDIDWDHIEPVTQDLLLSKSDAVLDALKAAGFAVIELPKPVGVNGADNRVWNHQPHYIEQEFNGDIVIDDRLGISAGDLLDLGATLIAAHHTAEANR